MRIKLQTDNGATYSIKRNDGVRFIAASASIPSNHPAKRWKKYRWAVWPKGHIEARMYFKSLHQALDHVIDGCWPAEGA